MNVLVIGSGGREHALCWKLRQSPQVKDVYCAPGNPGIAEVATVEPIPVDDITGLLAFAKRIDADLTVVGPELPLSLGVVDAFEDAGLRIFGPRRAAARLEASKSFAKEVMTAAGVPTAECALFDQFEELKAHMTHVQPPIVLKADGLASGKGVFVCKTREDVEDALTALQSMFGASSRVVVEEFLEGVEVSYIVATDGKRVVPMAASHDYKRLKAEDMGPNTGGMGAVCPTPRLAANVELTVLAQVIEPTLRQLEKMGTPFKGFLYAGLMIAPGGDIKVLEFNVRFGDPETQPILRRLEGDFAGLLFALAGNAPHLPQVTWNSSASVCVVLAAAGYPDSPKKGDKILGVERANQIPGVVVFQAGTGRSKEGDLVTNGGRVLNVTATGATVEEARARAYDGCSAIGFPGMQFREDIAR